MSYSSEYGPEEDTHCEENEVSEQDEEQEQDEANTDSGSEQDELNFHYDSDNTDVGDVNTYFDYCPVNETHFDLLKKLGSGAFGTVFLVKKNCGRDINKIYAMKVIAKEEVVKVPKTIIHMRAERKVLKLIRGSPFIPKLYYAFQTAEKLFLVIDYIPGGEMFTLLQRETMPEDRVRFYIAELIVALEHIHKHGIVYRDIKLENILIDADGHIRLVDFGLCKKLGSRGRTKSFCGTVEYMAPEVIACSGHNMAADWWALGVLTIELLSTVTPFGTNETPESNEIMNRITNDEPTMPANISPVMKDFILKMLEKDPRQRLGGNDLLATDIKEHPLFNDIDWDKLAKQQLPTPEIPNISDPYDVSNFSEDFTAQPASYEPSAVPPDTFMTFKGYSYIADGLDPRKPKDEDKIDENRNSSWDDYSTIDKNSNFHQKYEFVSTKPIGNGQTSVCLKCKRISGNTVYAVKIYKIQDQCDNQIDVLQKAAAKKLPGVVRLVDVLTDSKWTYLVMELVEGVNMVDYLLKNSYNGRTVHKTFLALMSIVNSVHSLEYAHRRICFKNFYCLNGQSPDKPEFRLIGFSNAMPMLHQSDEQIDLWSIGVCLYTLVCGHSPFMKNSLQTKRIETGDFDQASEEWDSLNKTTKRFIEHLFCSSTADSNSKDLRFLNNLSIIGVRNSKEQIDENEKIISIRAAKVQKYTENEFDYSAFNGFETTTNGFDPSESHEVISIHSDSQDESHSDHPESRNNHINNVNGHVKRAAKKRSPNTIEIENVPKKHKTDNIGPSPVKILQKHEIKKERIQQPAPSTRSLREKPQVSYKPTSLKGKIRSIKEIKKEKLAVPEAANRNAPKNSVQEKRLGRPKKFIKDPQSSIQPQKKRASPGRPRNKEQPTLSIEPQQNEVTQKNKVTQPVKVTQQIRPPSKRIAIKKEILHSTPTKPKTTKRLKKEGNFVSPMIAKLTNMRYIDRAVQTDSATPSQWVYPWPMKKPVAKYYCFERYDYH